MLKLKRNNVIIFAIVAIIIYFTFQLFILKKLNLSMTNTHVLKHEKFLHVAGITESKYPSQNNLEKNDQISNNKKKKKRKNQDYKSKTTRPLMFSENIFNLPFHFLTVNYEDLLNQRYFNEDNGGDKKNSIRGINKNDRIYYEPDSKGNFRCLISNKSIPFSNVNDDYCDCEDGTDEPGTNACANSIFFCDFQSEFLENDYIPSFKVNDHICDCCDMSDEYLTNVKCNVNCTTKIELIQSQLKLRAIGKQLKKSYYIEGRLKDEKLYGPDGIFFKLSQTCYTIKSSEFTYDVCPYKQIVQKSHGNSIMLGRTVELVNENSKWVLKMTNGDTKLCERARSSKIIFECDREEKLKRVEEPEKCVYAFYLNTPAAC